MPLKKATDARPSLQKPYIMAYYGLKFADDLHHNAVHEFKDWRTAPQLR